MMTIRRSAPIGGLSHLQFFGHDLYEDEDFAQLPKAERDRVIKWGTVLHNKVMLGTGGKTKRYADAGYVMGVGATAVCSKLKMWEETGDWRVFVDKRHRNGDNADMGARSPRFMAWLLTFVEQHGRTVAAAWRNLEVLFCYSDEVIPGFENRRRGEIPAGVSLRGLQRLCKMHAKELKRARFGNMAVRDLPVLTTRVGMLPGQLYEFDDVDHDNFVLWGGQQVRVKELGIIDYASGCRFHWGQIPAFKRVEDDKRQSLNRKMALMFLAYVLRYIGIHKDGAVLVMEHGTATLSKDKVALLEGWGGGMIKVRMGGIKGGEQKFLGGYRGRGHGNPMTKGAVEQSNRATHDWLSLLPGQTGTDRKEPAVTYGLTMDVKKLIADEEKLRQLGRIDLAEKLRMPILRFVDFVEYLRVVYALINGRTDHQLEGWGDKVAVEYELAGQWLPEQAFAKDPGQLAMLKMLVSNGSANVRERKLSPTEVWERGEKDLVKIPLALYVDLIGDERDFGRRVRVDRGMITVRDQYINGGEPITYLAKVKGVEGSRHLSDGDEYRVIMNPYATTEIVVMDEDGSIMGVAPEWTRVTPLDEEELYKRVGKASSLKTRDQAAQRARYASLNEEVDARRSYNRAIMDEVRGQAKLARSRRITDLPDEPEHEGHDDDLEGLRGETSRRLGDSFSGGESHDATTYPELPDADHVDLSEY